EILELPGYTRQEKLAIARRFLLPKQIAEHGLAREDLQLRFSEGAIMEMVDSYTREAGVRNLQREISSVVRGVAVKFVEGEVSGEVSIEAKDIPDYLGPQRFLPEMAERTSSPGVATGLAWTPTGGEIMFLEATAMPGKGGLMLTGQLGDVMKE